MQVLAQRKNKMRTFHVINGSKNYFIQKIKELRNAKSFLDLIKIHDANLTSKQPIPDKDKADLMVVYNDNYHAITEQANDRLGNLIYDLTQENAEIWVHNPPHNLLFFLKSNQDYGEINLDVDSQKYDIKRGQKHYLNCIQKIHESIIGQDNAIFEISKTLSYLTSVKRKKPYVIMLYGNSSIGKTELVREVSKYFFDGHLLEQHLSMYKTDVNRDYLFGDKPNRRSLGFDLLERGSNLIFLDEIDKCADYFYSVFYTLFDNTTFKDAVYDVDVSGALIVMTSNYTNEDEMKEKLGLPIYYRIDKFIHFEDFSSYTIYRIVNKEIEDKYEEYKKFFTKEEVYNVVKTRILSQSENARTIKNKVQAVLEELLFRKVLESED